MKENLHRPNILVFEKDMEYLWVEKSSLQPYQTTQTRKTTVTSCALNGETAIAPEKSER